MQHRAGPPGGQVPQPDGAASGAGVALQTLRRKQRPIRRVSVRIRGAGVAQQRYVAGATKADHIVGSIAVVKNETAFFGETLAVGASVALRSLQTSRAGQTDRTLRTGWAS